ncbi:MAG: caspase family protein, partial [Candidatus Pacebacteria bacterium]|nr:caspase family protein [Candidatus Paceibacterota bacterium]
MKKKILTFVFIGPLGVFLTSALFVSAFDVGKENRSEFRPTPAKNVQLIKKVTVRGVPDDVKVKPENPGKPGKPDKTDGIAIGTLGSSATGTKYAVVVGIADYPGTGSDLNYTDEDAEEMYQALTTLYGYENGNIHKLVDKNGEGATNATAQAIYDAVMDIEEKAVAGDEVFFFFSGHGGAGEAADGDSEIIDEAIIVHDGNDFVPIWDGDLKSWFSSFATSRIIFAFDTCRAGGMTDLAQDGRIINMATTETGTAYEFSALENGQFSYYFVDKGMLGGMA